MQELVSWVDVRSCKGVQVVESLIVEYKRLSILSNSEFEEQFDFSAIFIFASRVDNKIVSLRVKHHFFRTEFEVEVVCCNILDFDYFRLFSVNSEAFYLCVIIGVHDHQVIKCSHGTGPDLLLSDNMTQ